MKKLSIIGFGRFGKLAAEFLKEDFEVFVTDKINKRKEARNLGVKFVTLKEAASQGIVILAVPISELADVLIKIKPFLKKGTFVLDTCSLKEYPLNLMKKILPQEVEILGTHPLFGPDSISEKNKKIVLCPGRTKKLEKVKKYLQEKGFKVIITTPQHHDQQIAETLCFTHFIGKALLGMGINEKEIDTLGYNRLLKILETVEKDTDQLFNDMHKYNKYAGGVRKKFINALLKIDKKIKCQE